MKAPSQDFLISLGAWRERLRGPVSPRPSAVVSHIFKLGPRPGLAPGRDLSDEVRENKGGPFCLYRSAFWALILDFAAPAGALWQPKARG